MISQGCRRLFAHCLRSLVKFFFQDDIHRRSVTDKQKGIFFNIGDETPGSYLHLSDGTNRGFWFEGNLRIFPPPPNKLIGGSITKNEQIFDCAGSLKVEF